MRVWWNWYTLKKKYLLVDILLKIVYNLVKQLRLGDVVKTENTTELKSVASACEFESRHPYQGYKVYGPYTSKQDGRKRAVLVSPNGSKKTISYPKLLMELHLGRRLKNNETVDHIDRDFTNDSLTNLQVLDRSAHIALDRKRLKDLNVTCCQCGKAFVLSGNKLKNFVSNSQRKDRTSSGPFCSRKCAGKYNANVGHGKIEKAKTTIVPQYYTNKDKT